MATDNIITEIKKLADGASLNSDTVLSSQNFVASSIPKNYMWSYVSKTAQTSANPLTLTIKNDSIMSIVRGNYNCSEQPQKYRGTVEGNDTSSLYYPTHRHPRYVKNGENTYDIYPVPATALGNLDTTDHDGGIVLAYALYVNPANIDDASELKNAVIFYGAARELGFKSISKVVDWTNCALPASIPSPDFGIALDIITIAPQVPVLVKTTLDTTDWVAPSYSPPSMQLAVFPTLTWDFPTSPVAPSIASNSVESYASATPAFVPPASPSYDFATASGFITTEDTEMAQAQLGIISTQLSEYQTKMAEQQAKFNEENIAYQAAIGTNHQEAQLLEGFEGRKISKFSAEMSKYQQEVNTIIQENQSKLGTWTAEHAGRVQDYQALLGNTLNQFNKENVEYQSMIQKSAQNANFEIASEKDKLQKYQTELGLYQQDIGRTVTTFQQNLSQKQQEYGASIQKFQSDLGRANAQMQFNATEVSTNLTIAQHYDKLADKYYSWANSEINRFISNNERTTSRAMTAQQLNK
tara:strand:- start:2080 stop:3654 length:1575 start_codon:yes stop_codon:yes gene_type:complete